MVTLPNVRRNLVLLPRFGFACSNVLSYEVVLADGSVVVASATERSDLWRVLKGGSNNFGIVTHLRYGACHRPRFGSETSFRQASSMQKR